jgi:HTH-type transcriptional regulator/antitoxin HigA
MIRALHQGMGIPAAVLLQAEGTELAAPKYDLKKYPFNEMFNAGYFHFFNGALKEAKEIQEELLNQLFSVFKGMTFEKALPRSSAHEKMDEFALEAWQARALVLAEEQDLPPYVPNALTEEDVRYLARLSAFEEGPLLAREFLQKRGIPLVALKSLSKTYLDGACFRAPSGRPVIGVTLRHDRADNFWFTLLHELGHLILHLHQNNIAFFDETESNQGGNESRDPKEIAANDFAAKFLIPEEEWKSWRNANGAMVKKEEITRFANRLGVSSAIVAGRLRWEAGDYKKYSAMLGAKTVKKLLIG